MSDNDDLQIELEEEESGKPEGKLKKLRGERDEARKERDEYLTGWQRSKADYVNLQKRMREAADSASKSGLLALGSSVVTVFDSLEAAEESAKEASEGVQKGIKQVVMQLESVLKEHGITRYTPKKGDEFNPETHEPMQTLETSNKNEDNTVAECFQSGYALGETVIRPARVAVYKIN